MLVDDNSLVNIKVKVDGRKVGVRSFEERQRIFEQLIDLSYDCARKNTLCLCDIESVYKYLDTPPGAPTSSTPLGDYCQQEWVSFVINFNEKAKLESWEDERKKKEGEQLAKNLKAVARVARKTRKHIDVIANDTIKMQKELQRQQELRIKKAGQRHQAQKRLHLEDFEFGPGNTPVLYFSTYNKQSRQ